MFPKVWRCLDEVPTCISLVWVFYEPHILLRNPDPNQASWLPPTNKSKAVEPQPFWEVKNPPVSSPSKKAFFLYPKAKMAQRAFTRALRTNVARQIAAPVQRRTIATAFTAARVTVAVAPRIPALVQKRGIKTIDFAGVKEDVYGMPISTECLYSIADNICVERADWPREKLLVSYWWENIFSSMWGKISYNDILYRNTLRTTLSLWSVMVLKVCPHWFFGGERWLTITLGHGQGLNLRDNGLNVIIGMFLRP